MFIEKYTSTKEVINNFFRNTAYNEHVNLGDMAYWVYEAMELIGNPLQYIPKVVGHRNDSTYDLSDYRVELPCDFHRLIAISVDGVNETNANYPYFNHLLNSLWSNTAAITSISITPGGSPFLQYTTAYLYGITSATATVISAKASGGIVSADSTYIYHKIGRAHV